MSKTTVKSTHEVIRPCHKFKPDETPGFKKLYPEIDAYMTGRLKVDDLHELYYEQSGNPEGKPILVLHGGPGGGCQTKYRQYFNPEKYNIIMFDQRGAGKSTPFAELKDNTTWHLVADIEKLRETLGIEKWVVFGGSWGSTLSLSYSQTHPERVKAMVLRGIFMCRREELQFFYQEGSSWLFPDAWENFIAPIPEVERGDMISAYHRRVTGEDEEEKLRCAQAWSTWEMATSRLIVDPEYLKKGEDPTFALAFARIELHYFVNGAFMESNSHLLDGVDTIRDIPTVIVHGRYDVVCPIKSAWDLHRAWPEAQLKIVSDSGHSMAENGIASELVKATDKFADL